MRFIFCGYDLMLPCARRLMADGHDLAGIFTFDCDNVFNFNVECRALAEDLGLPFVTDPITVEMIGEDIDIVFAAGYPSKIPALPENTVGLNMHPSYLPRKRGIMPVPYILMEQDQNAAGITIHKMTQDYDAGDILLQQHIQLSADETVESYCAKSLLMAPDMIANVFADLSTYMQNASPQDETYASDCPPPSDEMRTFDLTKDVQAILSTARAFGRFGCLAHIQGALYSVFQLEAWQDEHDHPSGTCLVLQPKLGLIAVKDGYVCLKDFHKVEMA